MGWHTTVRIARRDMKLMERRAAPELRRRGKCPPPLDTETARCSASRMEIPLDLHLTPDDHRRLNGGVERVLHKAAHGHEAMLDELCALAARHARAR